MNYTENVIVPERTLLVSLDTGEYDAEESLRELWELAKSGGAEPIATMMQKRPSPETATCVGSGMVEEIRNFCENNEIELIIFDRELTPTQIRNLENATDVRVVDRTMLILDIFAQRAQSRAGKVQVEAAQLKYLLPRLTGKGTALSRLGGGIGTRGPGETKLETDRRHIRRRIEALREQLKKIEVGRHETQRRREKQMKYNAENGITPKTIKKSISATLKEMTETDFVKDDTKDIEEIKNVEKKIKEYTKLMKEAAANLEFETAVIYRDKIKELELLAMKNL